MSRDSELDQNLSGDFRKNFSSDLNEIWYVDRGRWVMHDGMPYGRNQGQGQGHSREVDRQSPTWLIFKIVLLIVLVAFTKSWVGVGGLSVVSTWLELCVSYSCIGLHYLHYP